MIRKPQPQSIVDLFNREPYIEIMPHIPKGVLTRSTHNPNSQEAQNYSIVEDIFQAPCTKSQLEVPLYLPCIE